MTNILTGKSVSYLSPEKFVNVEPANCKGLQINVALDQSLSNNFLLFNDTFPDLLGVSPSKKYRAGIVDGTWSFVYVPPEPDIEFITQESRIFREMATPTNGYIYTLFGHPVVVRKALLRFVASF